MNTEYLSAPLPFVGQKRMFAQKFKEVLKEYPDNSVFVDLFGGSGLLSHITKREKPNATVIYNDYDNYRMRLNNINRTNALLSDLRKLTIDCPRQKFRGKWKKVLKFSNFLKIFFTLTHTVQIKRKRRL